MITEITIKNYRSIADATVRLSPFTLLIGANGTGKSNFLHLLEEISGSSDLAKQSHNRHNQNGQPIQKFPQHINYQGEPQEIVIEFDKHPVQQMENLYRSAETTLFHEYVQIYAIEPDRIGEPEQLAPRPRIDKDGTGAVQILEALKTGDREDLFDEIEDALKRYIPDIEKLSFLTTAPNHKQLQVREKYINKPIMLKDLSDGTRLVLTILTIIYQENPPTLIGLEEIDRGLHPRLFQQVIDLLFRMVQEKNIQIIATTHNPYLVDQFKDNEDAVIIVEKEQGETKFTTLTDKLMGLEPEEEPLGSLWYSGFVGGVPSLIR